MRTFKRWSVAGAIVLVALALVACPALVPEPVGKISPMTFTVGDDPKMISDVDDLFTNTDDRSKFEAKSSDAGKATASVSGTTLTVTPVAAGEAEVTLTATLSNGKTATSSFMVTVKAAPTPRPDPTPDPDNNQPRLIADELPDVDDLKVGHPRTIELAPLFIDDEDNTMTFRAESSATGTAMASATSMGMLTLTAVSVGTARIHVYVEDGQHDVPVRESFTVTVVNQPPMAVMEGLSFNIGLRPGETDTRNLEPYFTDPENDPLTYTASVEPMSVAMASVDGTTLTIVAGENAGDATVTVTANDGTDDGSTEFTLRVSDAPNQAPMVKGDGIPDKSLTLAVMDGMESAMSDPIDLSMYFMDPDEMPMPLMYSDDSDMTMIEGSMLTIMADHSHSGMTMTITVTASDGVSADDITDMFDVMVMAPAAPTWKKEIPDVTFEYDGEPQTFMLADYFNHATMYATDHGDGTVVMAEVSDDQMLTLTRVGAGSAVVEITPSNSGGSGTTQSITVMVEAAAMKPMLKPDMEFMNVKMAMISDEGADTDDGDDAVTAEELAALKAATKRYMLTDYIRDPDGFADDTLTFSVMTEDPKIVAVYETPMADKTPETDDDEDGLEDAGTTLAPIFDARNKVPMTKLDKMMVEASDVTIRGRKTGTTRITVTATDVSGADMMWSFDVTVVTTANEAPRAGTSDNTDDGAAVVFPGTETDVATNPYGEFVDRNTTRRFKASDDATKWKLDLATIFNDPDVELNQRTTGDSWTFMAMSDMTAVATVSLEDTNNSEKPDEHNVVVTPVGPGDAIIYFTATDSFGESFGGKDVENTFFNVKVNNPPVAMSADDTPKTLADANQMGLAIGDELDDVVLVDSTPEDETVVGYFSDKDNDPLLCRFTTSGDEVATVGWLSGSERQTLELGAVAKKGTMTIRVRCWDQVGPTDEVTDYEASPWATLTIEALYDGSISD